MLKSAGKEVKKEEVSFYSEVGPSATALMTHASK